ncbi:cytochrome P450 [Aquabacterium sp. A7-Y]|uniref:cytochrome P450 n=1 Tax=Aquabacterium sp. A7-Y TaxID=1349605 RepID=UPI00223DAFC9|nr:cytochrome P450 [Aquabacterium sp. A7-Y]MCW7538645.1 cytochrome P450 [Aquabacterium sp. A7-Y]
MLAHDEGRRERFLLEVLRLFPPVPFLTRRCVEDTQAAGVFFRAGEALAVSVIGMHCHPDHWRSPRQFDAARPEFDASPPPVAFLPFSRGERVCAGLRLAKVELDQGLAAFLELRRVRPGPMPTGFEYGLSSRPRTSLVASRVSGANDADGRPTAGGAIFLSPRKDIP